jgi:formylglycine-generating enzyme required for sulfatase activity
MARTSYGRTGRRGTATFQWILIGMIFGFACAVIILFGLLTFNVMTINTAFGATETPNVVVITATSAPVTPTATSAPTETPSPTEELLIVQSSPVTATPSSPTPAPVTSSPTPTPTTPAPVVQSVGSDDEDIPPQLASIRSNTLSITGGTYMMGTTIEELTNAVRECTDRDGGTCDITFGQDSLPAHQVAIDPFEMEETEVTYGQYVTFLNLLGPGRHLNGCNGQICIATQNEQPDLSYVSFDSNTYEIPDIARNLPVGGVTWFGADAYCRTIGRRLPTEAEWERAARGEGNNVYPWGTTWNNSLAKTSRPTVDEGGTIGPVEVGTYPSGAFGLFDMAGNIGEWVYDWYDTNWYQAQVNTGTIPQNPTGPVAGTQRVIRGGSWDQTPFFSRGVHRLSGNPAEFIIWAGFRCAADRDADSASSTNNTQPNLAGGTTPLALTGTADPSTLGLAPNQGNTNSQPTLPAAPTTLPLGDTEGTELPSGG